MKIRFARFPLGSSYYPPAHDPADWQRDLQAMRAAGLNTVRTAELITSWDYIEPRRGHPEWDWLDRTFELAERHGIDIVLGTGSCNPPIWMLESFPDLQRVSREGVPYPTNTVWGWACINHPGLRSELRRYLSLLLERYGASQALLCWQIDNQIGHSTPFTGAEHAHPRRYGYYCYCEHCAALFRSWLEERYRDIDSLNHAWTWDPTHYRYYGWHQLQPPRSMPAEWGNGTAWFDFRRFVHESFSDYIRFQHELIKAADPEQLTMHNLYDCLRPDLGARNEPNHWDIGGIPDIIGHDIYPSENNYRNDPEHASWFLDFAWSVARHNDKTMWIPELESGPLGGFSAGPNVHTTALDIKRFNLFCLGHGAKGMLYQGYRDWNFIPLHWGGLVDYHGAPTERYHAAAEVAGMVREHEDFFLDAEPAPAQVAIYHSHENVILIDGQANERFLYGALRGVHTALWRQKLPIQFVEPRFVGGPSADYRVIVLPFVMHMPRAHAERLERFVAAGGTLIGFAKLGHLDERGWAWNDRPGGGLDRLFGARETRLEVFREPHEKLRLAVDPASELFAGVEETRLEGYWHRQGFELADDVEVLARFTDGEPAIIERRHGRGRAVLFASHLDIAAWELREPGTFRLFENLLRRCGVRPPLRLESEDRDYLAGHIDSHLLERGDERAVIVSNEGTTDITLGVTLAGLRAAAAFDGFGGAEIALEAGTEARFSLRLAATDASVIMLRGVEAAA